MKRFRPSPIGSGAAAALAALAALLAAAPCHASPPSEITLTVQGQERQAFVAMPDDTGAPAPLVFAFHGHGGSARLAQKAYRCEELWPEAVVVYPQGLPTPGGIVDPQGRRSGWQLNPGDHGDRDLAFFDELLRYVRGRASIDGRKVYVVGHSNGALFAYLLWAARGESLAGIGPIAGIFPTKADRTGLRPMPVFHVAGRNDPIVQFAWQEETMALVRMVNGCGEVPMEADGFVSVYGSSSGKPLVTYIDEGGHGIPQGAMARILGFFKEQGRMAGL